jgi:hypothetical protein
LSPAKIRASSQLSEQVAAMSFGLLVTLPPPTKHDWVVCLGDWRFGIMELEWNYHWWDDAHTAIFVGPTAFYSDSSACWLLAIAGFGLLVGAFVLSFIISRLGRKQEHLG